jgi:hypothetical protein
MFSEFLNLLNENQGVIAIIGITLTIIGFFITNIRIINKIDNSQSQKSGKDSKNNQAGRDIKIGK